jgi:hypothetical protein
MQPNLKVPQAPYAISPTSRIPRNTIMDVSLDALMQQKIREAQYAQQQKAVAMRTPTVLFDPLLNVRVRDYYRQKYERTALTEMAGRALGGAEGGALGAGIGASIGGIISIIAAIEPTWFGEAAAGIYWAGWGALAGATIGSTYGVAKSDYTTYHATVDMFKNLWGSGNVGQNVLNTMYFVGQTMDLASTATVIKSTLYSAITGESITKIVRRAYGLSEEGRVDMDYSLIREALGIDLGGIGNFIFDMAGEISSDIGAISGIVGSVMEAATVAKVYSKVITEAGQKIMTEDALGKGISKAFIRAIREGNIDDAMLFVRRLKDAGDLADGIDINDLRPFMEKYIKEINKSAQKYTAVRLANAFKGIDIIDDTMTHALWNAGNPVILGGTLIKKANEYSIFPKALQALFGDEKAMEIYEFFAGNFAKAKGIINPMSSAKMKDILKKQHYSFIENLVDDNGFKRFRTTIAESITDKLQKQEFYRILDEEGIDDIVKLKNSENTIIKAHYEKAVKESYEKLNKLELEIEEKRNAQQIIIKRLESGKGTAEDGKKLVELENEINAIIASDEYKAFSYIKLMLEQPEEIRKLSKIVSTLYHLQRKHNFLGKLSDADQKLLDESFQVLVDEVVKGNKLVESFFEQYDYMNVGSGKLTKSLKEFISENIDSSIRKQFDDFYQGKIKEFEKFATDSLPTFKKAWVEQMTKRLQKAKIDVDNLFGSIDPNDIDAKYKAIKNFLDDYDDADSIKMTLDKRTKAYKIKQELDKKIQEITTFQNRYDPFINTQKLLYDEAYRYTGYTSQAVLKKRAALIEEAMKKILSADIPREAIEEFKGNINAYVEFLGGDIIKDKVALAKYLNKLMEAMISVQPNTGKLSRVINNMIPKYLKWIKNIQDSKTNVNVSKLKSFKDKILEEVEKIERTLLRNAQDEQLRSIIKDIKSLFDTDDVLSIDTYKVMNKIYELQERQIRVAFKDIDNKSIDFIEAVARAEESFNDEQKRLLEKLTRIRKTVKDEKAVQLVEDFILNSKELKQEQISSLPEELKELVKDYIEVKKHLNTIKQLADYKHKVDTIYSGLNAYIKDIQTAFKSDTNEIYTAQDMIDDYVRDYINGLKNNNFSGDNSYTNRRIYYDADSKQYVELEEEIEVNKSPFIEKEIPNRYYASRRLLNTLRLCEDTMPMVYGYFVKLVDNFIKNSMNGKITPELQNAFVDELKQLLTINKQIKTLNKIGLVDISSLVVRNGKLVPSKQLPKPYGKLLKTIINLSEDDLMRIDLVKDKLRKCINEILTEEDINNLPPKFSKAINDIKNGTTTTEKVATETAGGIMSDILNKHFVDGLFSYEKPRSSFIRKAKNVFIGDPDITKKSFVVFDTETTGETSHGVYSIYATRWTYDGQKWVAEEGIQFCLDPDFIEANWKIDLAVDKLNAKSSRQFLGSTLGKAKQLRDDALYNGRPVYKSDQEMALAFKAYLQEGDILVAHNSAFDFSELMNAMSGGRFMKQGVIDDVAAEEFAKTDFDFTVMDTALLQSYTGIFADTKQLSNSWLGRASGLVDVVEVFTDTNNKKTYFVNGVEVDKIQTTKDKVLRFEYDAEDNLVKGSYNGGDLHEAANDVELMNAWFEGGLNKLTETGAKLSDLDNPDMFFDNMMKDRLNTFYTKEFKQKIKLLLDNFNGVNLDDEPNLVGRIKDCLLTIQDENLSYKERMMSVYELEDILQSESYQDYIKQGRINFSSSYKKKVGTAQVNKTQGRIDYLNKELQLVKAKATATHYVINSMENPEDLLDNNLSKADKQKKLDYESALEDYFYDLLAPGYYKRSDKFTSVAPSQGKRTSGDLRRFLEEREEIRAFNISQRRAQKEIVARLKEENSSAYEEAVEKVEHLYRSFEDRTIDVDELKAQYQEYKELLKQQKQIEQQIEDLKKGAPEIVEEDVFDFTPFSIEEIDDDFIAYNTAVTRDISKIRGIHEKEIIGHLKVNSFYTKIVQSMNFKYNSAIQNLVDLFNNNANGTLSGNLRDVAERLAVISKDPKYELAFAPIKEIQQILKDMDDSMTWYTELISETEPVMYDTLDNVIRKIQSGEYHNKPKDIIYRDILLFVQKRASQNNFDYIKAVEMVNKVFQNVDEIRIPDSDRISNLYNKCLDAFSALLQHLQTVGVEQSNDALAGNAKEMLDLIHDSIESMRSPLRNIKAENKLQKLMPFTAREFSEMSMISEDTVNKLKGQGHTFDYMGKPIEFDPTTHMHRMTPGEAIAWRSKLVPSFTDEHLDGISIKSKINDMLSSLFKKTEGEPYKALPYIDADQSRLVQYFRLASTAFGVDLETLVNTVYQTGAYKNFEKNFTKYNELLNQLLSSSDEELARLNINKLALNQFVSQVMSINEFTFEYISDSNMLKKTIIAAAMHNLLYGNYKVFDAVPLRAWSDLSETAEEVLGKLTHEPFLEAQMNESIKLFSDVKAIFTNLDGTYDVEGFVNYLNTHPDYFLVYMDTNGKFIRLANDPKLINEILSSDDIFVTVMPRNSFNQLTNYVQPVKLGPKARWFQENILRPMKMMSLTNLNFTFQNIMSATFQNMISTSGKVDAPKAIGYMVRMAKDYHRYNNLFISVTSSYTARKYLTGSLYTMDKRWVDLLNDDNFKLALKANNEEDVLEMINKLTPEDIERFKFINEARNTSAARGEISSITLNNKREEALKREADEARKKLIDDYPDRYQEMLDDISKFKNDPDYDKIAPLVSQVNHRRYQEMSVEDLQKLLDELEKKPDLDYYEKRQKYALKKVIKDKQSGFWDAIFKHQAVSWWFDMNENLETIFRLSAMDMYIKEGSTFNEATAEVIKRHFIYNNKSAAEQYAEFVIPFISYPLRMFFLVNEITKDSTVMDMMFWFDKYSWGEEEHEHSEYLTRRKARGDIPVGDQLFSLSSPFNEGVMNFQHPLYSLNNKINPLAKPLIDLATGSEYNRWNQLPGISLVNNVSNVIKERSLVANFTNDYYRYERFTNYYRPRVNNKIYGSLYNRMYTKSGYSRVLMNMQPLSSSNLKYRVNSIMKYSGPTNTRR